MSDNYFTYTDVTEILITERERDIDSITQELYDVREAFVILDSIVQEQSFLLDHIKTM